MTAFQDLFSRRAADYARHRPGYPPALFVYLASHCGQHRLAWDVGTGNGQAALGLAEHFDRVIATDASTAQLAQATPHQRIEYRVALAEEADLPAGGVDLVTVAQALHWFRLDAFYANVRRIAAPGGLLAVWCYSLPRVNADVDAVCDWFYRDIVGPYWPPDRHHIEERYMTIPFPFDEIRPPAFEYRSDWTLADYVGYIETWSAVQNYRKQRGADPIVLVASKMADAWVDAEARRPVLWPLYMRIGRVVPLES